MHPSTEAILCFFTYDHLHGEQRELAQEFADFAHRIAKRVEDTPHGAELTTGLRKIMEAKDCIVRATLPAEPPSQAGPAHSISHRDEKP